MLAKCLVPPERSGYAVNPGDETVDTKLDGGLGRYRKDQIGASASVTVQWTVSGKDYNYLMAFYRQSTQRRSLPFLIDLVLDYSNAVEYTAYFTAPPALQSNSGDTYVLQATLEVQPLPDDPAGDQEILARNS